MKTQENASGKPLADALWLENHHRAKLPERTAFAQKLADLHPKRIVDLGCASGLWLELLDKLLPSDCEFIGIDSDNDILKIAKYRSKNWNRKASFIQLDIESEALSIPSSDLTLAFNIFSYIQDLEKFINILANRVPRGMLAVRQYDGASIRFGPMNTATRQQMEVDLRIATENSKKFYHYDLDRAFSVLHSSSYDNMEYSFELFERTSPFDSEFLPYYNQTLEWTCQHLSEVSAERLKEWMSLDSQLSNKYFYEVDLIALLS